MAATTGEQLCTYAAFGRVCFAPCRPHAVLTFLLALQIDDVFYQAQLPDYNPPERPAEDADAEAAAAVVEEEGRKPKSKKGGKSGACVCSLQLVLPPLAANATYAPLLQAL